MQTAKISDVIRVSPRLVRSYTLRFLHYTDGVRHQKEHNILVGLSSDLVNQQVPDIGKLTKDSVY